jgi:hypothetical protein
MGYIHDFEVVVADMLSELDEKKRKQVLTYVKATVIESFRNGIAAGKLTASGGSTPEGDTSQDHGGPEGHHPPRREASHPQGRESARPEPRAPASGRRAYR